MRCHALLGAALWCVSIAARGLEWQFYVDVSRSVRFGRGNAKKGTRTSLQSTRHGILCRLPVEKVVLGIHM